MPLPRQGKIKTIIPRQAHGSGSHPGPPAFTDTTDPDELIDNLRDSTYKEGKKKSLIDKGLKVDAQHSSYLGYGSYSGADIKVVVHIPKSLKKKRELEELIAGLRKQLNELTTELNSKDPDLEVIAQTAEVWKDISLTEVIKILEEEIKKAEAELKVFMETPTTKTLAELQSISWSVFREKSPVRTLGSVYPRAFTRGPRTIAGTMVFTVFYKHVFHEMLESNHQVYNTGAHDIDQQQNTPTLPDQLPPMDISLSFANEYGAVSYMGLYGVEFVQDGGTFSIEDILSENVVQYVARDIDPLKAVQFSTRNAQGVTGSWTTDVTAIMSSEYDTEKTYITEKRRNPFI